MDNLALQPNLSICAVEQLAQSVNELPSKQDAPTRPHDESRNTTAFGFVVRRHAANLAELDPADGAKIFQVAQKLSAAVRKSGVRCEGINLRLNDGAPAGQRVFHVHLHIIPRHSGDAFSRFVPPPFNDDPPWELMNGIAQAIREQIE